MHLLLIVAQSVKLYPTLCNRMDYSTPGFPDLHYSWRLLKLVSIGLVMPPNHLILCCPLILLPSIFPSIMVFSNDLASCIRWPKYWSFSISISPSNEYSGVISFRIDSVDPLTVQGSLKSLLQHHSSKTAYSSLFSLLYGPTLTSTHDYWKNHNLDYMDHCCKMMSLLFKCCLGFP